VLVKSRPDGLLELNRPCRERVISHVSRTWWFRARNLPSCVQSGNPEVTDESIVVIPSELLGDRSRLFTNVGQRGDVNEAVALAVVLNLCQTSET
jgi:hypothetical protein